MKERYVNIDTLLAEISEKDSERAFRLFFDMYYSKLLHLSYLILKNEDVAKDVVLEVFEKIWEQRQGLTKIESIDKYLYVLAKNKAIDQLRRNKELIVLDSAEAEINEKILLDHPENILLDKELSEKIAQAILNLPDKCRLVYRLIKEDGLKYKEVSELLNLSPKTIDNHISLAMGRIRLEVNAYLNESRTKKSYWRVVKSLLFILSI